MATVRGPKRAGREQGGESCDKKNWKKWDPAGFTLRLEKFKRRAGSEGGGKERKRTSRRKGTKRAHALARELPLLS